MIKIKKIKEISLLLIFITFIFWFNTCAPMKGPWEIDETKIGRGFNLLSKQDELNYSNEISEKIEEEMEILHDSLSEAYINRLGMKIVKSTHLKNLVAGYDWSFKIINSSNINAFATLGGKIYVYRGLIENVEKEPELAGVIAHEIGHVMGRHVSKQITKRALINAIVEAGVLITGSKGGEILSEIFKIAGGVGAFFANLKYSRDDEREADYLAVRNLYDAKYDPHGLITFFKHLKEIEKERGAPLWWLSTHPPIQERIEWISYHISRLPSVKYESNEANFRRIRNHLKALPRPKEKEKKEIELEPKLIKILNIPGNSSWFDTGIDLENNQEILIEALGEICLQKGNPQAWCSPEGLSIKTLQQPIPDENLGALIGKIGEESTDYFLIGRKNRIKVFRGGRLFLGINEYLLNDNAGNFTVKIYFLNE
jgi:predicted Zn-dependent protease